MSTIEKIKIVIDRETFIRKLESFSITFVISKENEITVTVPSLVEMIFLYRGD
ncbi:hypothetical protein M153_8666000881, partial [Pseudoloma neurophilia]